MNWRGQRPKMTLQQYRALVAWKTQRDALPSLREIAAEIGVPLGRAKSAIRRGVKRFDRPGAR